MLSILFDDVFAPLCDHFAQKAAIDIGANIGNHSLFLASRFKRVIGFEPGSVANHLLLANRLLNNIANVEPHQIGLSDQDKQASLIPKEANNIGSKTVAAGVAGAFSERIELRRGDEVLEGIASLEPIGLVKIDVEGHETEALRGLEATVRKHQPIILFETTGRPGRAAATRSSPFCVASATEISTLWLRTSHSPNGALLCSGRRCARCWVPAMC